MNKTGDTNLWGIHAGKTGDAGSLFLKKNCIAVGWTKMGDLSPLNPERQMHLGWVEGDYRYDPNTEPGYPHVRTVKWLRTVLRTWFSQGALYEIGSAMSLFLVKNYADEFRATMEGEAALVLPVAQDDSVAAVAEDIEETTRDFVLKRLAQELKGHPFADFVAHLLNTMGYRTSVSPEGPDGGKVGNSEFGLLVTLGTFTTHARNFARSKGNLRLIDGDELVELVFQHYNQFNSRYKGLLPLRRMYVPEAIESDEA